MQRSIASSCLAVAFAAALSLVAPLSARAQACSCAAPTLPARWSVFASTGGGTFDVAQMNTMLTANGFTTVSRDAIAIGGGGFLSWGPLRLGAEHVRLDGGAESNGAGLSARIEANYTTLTVGWDFRPRGRLSVAPTLGVGRGAYVLTVGDRNDVTPVASSPAPTFDEILADPGRESVIEGEQWVIEPMLAGELLVLRSAAHRRGVTVGARIGYRIAPNRPDWEYRDQAVAGGPVDQAKGPIVRLTIGIGGR